MFKPSELSTATRRRFARVIHRTWAWVSDVGALTPDDDRARRFGHLGEGSWLAFPQGVIFGEEWIHIGARTLIAPEVSLSAGMTPGQEMGAAPIIVIGERCSIGRGSHIVGHLGIEIGDDVYTGPYVYITDQNHTYTDLDVPIGRQWPTEERVHIGAGSWLGTNVVVLPGAWIGEHTVVAAGAIVRGTFPDRCVLAGAPARIVRQHVEGVGWSAT